MNWMNIPLKGTMTIEVTSADIGSLLTQINRHDISFWNVQYADSLTVRLQIARSDVRSVKSCVEKRGGTFKTVRNSGLY